MLADSANKFKNAGGQLKRQMRCRLIKIYLFFGILITAALSGIIAYFVCVRGHPSRPGACPRARAAQPTSLTNAPRTPQTQQCK